MDPSIIEHHVRAVDLDGFTIIGNAIEPSLVAELRDTIRRIEGEKPNLVRGTLLRTVGLHRR